MVDFAKLQGNERVYDLGCGDGRLLFETKRRFPGMTAVGYEVSPYPYLKALARNTATRRGYASSSEASSSQTSPTRM
jgi:cyclopropane fatty-acyl-phospholipid synthase-like methyltransferase